MTDRERFIKLIFPLQAAWPFVHGSGNAKLLQECRELLSHGQDDHPPPSAERNDRIHAALVAAWQYVNIPYVTNTAKAEVLRGDRRGCAHREGWPGGVNTECPRWAPF